MSKIIEFLKYWFSAKTTHGTHSPFIYALLDECVYAANLDQTVKVKQHYKALKSSTEKIRGNDFGRNGEEKECSVSYFAKSSSMLDFQAEFLARFVAYSKPNQVLELGTNIGKSAAFMAISNKQTLVTTVDGNQGLSVFSQSQFNILALENINCVNATFDAFLSNNSTEFDMVFLDGNHHYEPTVYYFNQLKNRISAGGAIVFHDIYWSKGMKRAWHEIKRDQSVSISLDLFFFGIVWIGKNQAKQDFKVRFPRYLFRLFFLLFF